MGMTWLVTLPYQGQRLGLTADLLDAQLGPQMARRGSLAAKLRGSRGQEVADV